jgi:DNA mismatch endonuclease (patch repair protein)
LADHLSKSQRSRLMAVIRNANTSPELIVRKRLFSSGFRYRIHYGSLPGKPDIALPKFRIAVFVNGCFWHGHACRRGKRPSTNTAFWNKKLDSNLLRDRKNIRALGLHGWKAMIVWQCEIEAGTDKLLQVLESISKENGGVRYSRNVPGIANRTRPV